MASDDAGFLIAQFLVFTCVIVEILARLFPRYWRPRKQSGASRVNERERRR